MNQIKVILPAMGEGIFEATIIQWLAVEGATVAEDESLVEIATDKVDSEVPAPVSGVLSKILVTEGSIAKVGQVIAIINVEDSNSKGNSVQATEEELTNTYSQLSQTVADSIPYQKNEIPALTPSVPFRLDNGAFLSPLVRSIAQKEDISVVELGSINGTGLGGRITKDDLWNYLEQKKAGVTRTVELTNDNPSKGGIEIVEMSRLRKLIAENMLRSRQVSAHVTSFHEVDLTEMVTWREKNKELFQKQFGQKLTYTPLFLDSVVKAIQKFPLINISVEESRILVKKQINIGMATALPDGNLIVPVIHHANTLSPLKLVERVNDLANRARNKQLLPNEIQGGTFTVTNVGTFGNLSGTPIINQPEVAILAVGAIKKRPAVVETPQGDFIAIRNMMILSLSYDHRVIDGSLGGMFLKQVADNMEAFDGKFWL